MTATGVQESQGFLSLVRKLGNLKKRNLLSLKDLPKIPTREELVERINLFMQTEGAMDALMENRQRYAHYLHAYKRAGSGLDPRQYSLSAIEVMRPLRVNGINL